jgi:hypothetical protein
MCHEGPPAFWGWKFLGQVEFSYSHFFTWKPQSWLYVSYRPTVPRVKQLLMLMATVQIRTPELFHLGDQNSGLKFWETHIHIIYQMLQLSSQLPKALTRTMLCLCWILIYECVTKIYRRKLPQDFISPGMICWDLRAIKISFFWHFH